MDRGLRILVAAGWLFLGAFAADEAAAQKSGGILKVYHRDSAEAAITNARTLLRGLTRVANDIIVSQPATLPSIARAVCAPALGPYTGRAERAVTSST